MPRKTFRLDLGSRERRIWGTILPAYAAIAFPPGTSECAQASHAALMDLAQRIVHAGDGIDIGAHQRPMLRGAVKWYFGEICPDASEDRELLLARLQRR